MNQGNRPERSPEQLAAAQRAWYLAVEAFGGKQLKAHATTSVDGAAPDGGDGAVAGEVQTGPVSYADAHHETVEGLPRQTGIAEHDLGAVAVVDTTRTTGSDDYLQAVDDALAVVAAGRALDEEAERLAPLAPVHDIRTGQVIG